MSSPITLKADGSIEAQPRLRPVLTLRDLVLYGIILIMPIAPVPLFGLIQQLSRGQAITTILLSMVAMVLTAYSYGRMASLYPSAGSAYLYVGCGLNAHLGFMAGWAMFLDYLLVPLACTIYGAVTLHRLMPGAPYAVWIILLVCAMTFTNLQGIRVTSGANLVLLLVILIVVFAFFGLAVRFLFVHEGWHGLFALQPFYDPSTFHFSSIAIATSVAALTYGGFDGISTLAEDARNPRKDILLATILVCIFTGLFGGLQIYLAQRIWPSYNHFPNVETAFMDVAKRVGGPTLFEAFAAILIVGNLGAAMTAQAGLSRLLFGMGRDGMLPSRFFGRLNLKSATPVYNLLFIGILTLVGALILNYEQAAELINFGALLAFMGVNAATIRSFYFAPQAIHKPRLLPDAIVPLLGLLFCLTIWLSLPMHAKILGGAWFVLGVTYDGIRTKGFTTTPAMYHLPLL